MATHRKTPSTCQAARGALRAKAQRLAPHVRSSTHLCMRVLMAFKAVLLLLHACRKHAPSATCRQPGQRMCRAATRGQKKVCSAPRAALGAGNSAACAQRMLHSFPPKTESGACFCWPLNLSVLRCRGGRCRAQVHLQSTLMSHPRSVPACHESKPRHSVCISRPMCTSLCIPHRTRLPPG